MSWSAATSSALAVLFSAACGAPDPACAGVAPAAFASEVAPLFHRRCGGVECHGANLGVRAHLVGAPAIECADGRALVVPGEPSASYLWNKLTGERLCAGSAMPKRGPPLTDPERAAVLAWICAGAPDD